MNKSDTKSKKSNSGSKSPSGAAKKAASPKIGSYEKWQITTDTATEMKVHRNSHGNDTSNIIDYNDKIRKEIDLAFPKGQKTWEPARYRNEEDEARYSELRNITNDAQNNRGKKGKVKGYRTWIYMVVNTSKWAENITYYDIATIKPPPEEI